MKNRASDGKGRGRRDLIRPIDRRPARLFAIGDIHGCFTELDVLLTHLIDKQGLSQEDQVIFIGDYIDRGPASRAVIARLIDFKKAFPETVFLRGNHEDMLMSFLGLGGHAGQAYLANGGQEFFESYGIQPLAPLSETLAQIPDSHRTFFAELECGVSVAEFVFVHAGLRPTNALELQNIHDLIWIRTEFTTKPHELGKTIVFGHTPYEDVLIHLPYKVGIDTGLVYGNKLSCVELVEGDLYQVDFGEMDVKVASLKDRLGSTTA
jgi:serine/threonine protein phosphatase 1